MPIDDARFFNYLPVAEDQFGWGLYVTGAGEGTIAPNASYPPRDHPSLYAFDWREGRVLPEYQIILISDGEGEFRSRESGHVKVREGSVIVLFPDVWHSYRPNPRTGWHETWMSLNGTVLYELQRQRRLDPKNPVLLAANAGRLRRELRLVVQSIRTRPAENSLALSAGALRVLADVVEHSTAAGPEELQAHEAQSALVRDALRLIWNWSYRQITVRDLSAALHVSSRTLERRFLAELGSTVHERIASCRLQRAQILLRNTRLPIKHVAFAAGFSTAERMSKVFQRMLSMSPRKWQEAQGFRRGGAR